MKLVRLALLYFDKGESALFNKNWAISIEEDVTIESKTIRSTENPIEHKKCLLVIATIELSQFPEKDENNVIIVPNNERIKLEQSIEKLANIIAIAERCSRIISSPSPCVAFSISDAEDEIWLKNSKGIQTNRTAIPCAMPHFEINEKVLNLLSDRADGAALLAEALSSNHAGNKYREYTRLFECAFRMSIPQIEKKLSQFLEDANLGYTRAEVKKWIEYRHGLIHADGKKANQIVLESDVRKYIPRMEQAAYDVLFNKRNWGSASKERIENWKPDVALTNAHADISFTKGKPLDMRFQAFDEFQVFPLDLNGVITQLPVTYWSKWAT